MRVKFPVRIENADQFPTRVAELETKLEKKEEKKLKVNVRKKLKIHKNKILPGKESEEKKWLPKLFFDQEGNIIEKERDSGVPVYHVLKKIDIDEKERQLSIDLFGTESLFNSFKKKEATTNKGTSSDDVHNKSSHLDGDEGSLKSCTVKKRRPAWKDEDDAVREDHSATLDLGGTHPRHSQARVIKARNNFVRVFGDTPNWALLNDDADTSVSGGVEKTTGNYLSKDETAFLPKAFLKYEQEKDASMDENSFITSVEFNKGHEILLVSATSHYTHTTCSLFRIRGEEREQLQSCEFPKLPRTRAHFYGDGTKYVVVSKCHQLFYTHDMESNKTSSNKFGTFSQRQQCYIENFRVTPDGAMIAFICSESGEIKLFDARTMSLMHRFQVPEIVRDVTFNSDGSRMYTCGVGGNVFVFDVASRACIFRYYDEGAMEGTAISLSPNQKYLACGSASGIVNMYDTADLKQPSPLPVKSLKQIVTPVTSLKFNATSEILLMASKDKHFAARLVQLPSLTVFGNFPHTGGMPKVNVTSGDFSPSSAYMALGTSRGKAKIYRLSHYGEY